MSLWDMINFNIFQFSCALHMVEVEESLSRIRPHGANIDEVEKDKLRDPFLKFIATQCAALKLKPCAERIGRIREHLDRPISWQEWHNDVRTLRETMIDSLKGIYCYHYPADRAVGYVNFRDQWGSVISKFPSAVDDAEAAVDCYALDQNTASVFHSMRVAEIGLRALAKERGVRLHKRPLEWGTWQDIINAIRAEVKRIANAEAGPARDAALSFYQGALGEFESFKDVYRNQVMHVREAYNAEKAMHTLNHVREFMKRLSSKIDEVPTKKLKWGLRWRKAKNP